MQLLSFEINDLYPFSLPFLSTNLKKTNLIIGNSGSGKTTLLRSLFALYSGKNESLGIDGACVLNEKANISGSFNWNNEKVFVDVFIKNVRNNAVAQGIHAAQKVSDEFILAHEKTTPYLFVSDRTIDIKSTEFQNLSSHALDICHEIITDYSVDFEEEMEKAIASLCENLPIQLKPRFDFKKALSFETTYQCSPTENEEITDFSNLSSGEKKHVLLNFMIDRASDNPSNPIFIDCVESFLDKRQLEQILKRLSAINNQVFISTHSSHVYSTLNSSAHHIICSSQQDTLRTSHAQADFVIEQFLY